MNYFVMEGSMEECYVQRYDSTGSSRCSYLEDFNPWPLLTDHGGCAASSTSTTTHNAQRAGVRGRRKLRHPAPPPAPLLEVRNELEDRYRLPVCDGRHDDRRQPQPPPPPTPTTTTDDGRRRAEVSKPRPERGAAEYPGRRW